jgi:hypothetical protein
MKTSWFGLGETEGFASPHELAPEAGEPAAPATVLSDRDRAAAFVTAVNAQYRQAPAAWDAFHRLALRVPVSRSLAAMTTGMAGPELRAV